MDTSFHLLFALLLSAAAPGWCQQSVVEQIANSMQISFAGLENYSPVAERCQVRLSIRNIGTETIQSGNWNIYFCSIRMVAPDDLVEDNVVNAEGAKLGDSGFTVFHVAGCLFRLQPNDDFRNIAPGNEIDINYIGEFWIVSRTDIMPNFYIGSTDGESAAIPNTVDQMVNFATDFTQPRQYKRMDNDQFSPYTPQMRYDRYVANDQGRSPLRIIPQPLNMNFSSPLSVHIDSSWVVYDNTGTSEFSFEATFLADKLGLSTTNSMQPTHLIELIVNSSLSILEACENNRERYKVEVEANKATVIGAEFSGLFHGVQTLLAALSEDNRIGIGSIEDCPRFEYRGFMADVGRHFLPMEEILRILDAMAMYKLNKFHFHLSDDEGFRVEIPDIPELTTVGATQCHDIVGDDCIMPQLGSPPTKESTGSGYYTVEEYKNILQHANNLHIQVIPEIDMPGHAHAIIKAIESRNRTLNDLTYILWDPEDRTPYLSVQYFTDNAINPCINSTYTFVEFLIDAFIDMHRGIQDLQIFHWGGDEVPGAWIESPACRKLAEQDPSLPLNATMKDIKGYFAMRVKDLIDRKGLFSAAWEDGVLTEDGDPIEIPAGHTAYVNAWSNVWEWGNGGLAYILANSGYKSIISHATHTYFDHPVEPDPEERGYYWATRFTDAYKTFSYVASDIYKNIDIDRFGATLTREEVCEAHGCPPLERPENIAGIQGHIWSETMRTAENVHGMVFPRLLALAERAWHQADWENENDTSIRKEAINTDWQGYANRVGYRELRRLDALGIKYDLRPPAVLVDNNLMVKTEYPGLRVEVSTDWGITWEQYYPGMAVPDTDAIFVTKSADGSRRSRTMKYDAPLRPEPSHAPSIRNSLFTTLILIVSVTISFNL